MGKQTLPPFLLEVLTSEYLIDGTVPGDTSIFFPKPNELGYPIQFTNVKIQPTKTTEVSARTYTHYIFTRNDAIALIPRMDFTQLPLYSSWKQFKNPITGLFHLGPYWMTGRLMNVTGEHLWGDNPVIDVRFGSQVPGSNWNGLSAPFALVNGFWIQGWVPD